MRTIARGALAVATSMTIGATGLLTNVAPAHAAAKPTLSKLPDVNINLGMTRRVTVHAKGATAYEWRLWRAGKGWILLARGGAGYASINFTGDADRHMGVLQVTAINAAGRTTGNLSRLRVWGIAPSYPATPGTAVRTGGWQITAAPSIHVNGEYLKGVQTKMTVTKLSAPAAVPGDVVQATYVDTRHVEHFGEGAACDDHIPGFVRITALAAGSTAGGYLCTMDGLSAAGAAGGRWKVEAAPTAFATPGPVAWFRGL